MSETKVVTGKIRFSYLNIHEPKAVQEGGKPKYSASLIIRKDDEKTLAKVKAGIEAAFQEGVGSKFGGTAPKKWKNPLRDGDDERDDAAYAGCYFVNCNSDLKPGLVDANRDPIFNAEDFYSGCYGRASINFYPFNFEGTKGVACGLNNLQKLEDGPRLAGVRTSAEDDFGAEDDDDLL